MKLANTFFVGSLLIGAVGRADAQQTATDAPTYDLLTAAHAGDSLRKTAARRQAEMAKLSRVADARADSLARMRQEIAALRARTLMLDSANRRVVVPRTVHDTIVVVAATSAPPNPTKPVPAAAPSVTSVSGLVQLWMAAGDAGFRNTYRVRRAEVRASGVVTPTISWTVMADLGKSLTASATTTSTGAVQMSVAQSSRILQDVNISIQPASFPRIDVGQQKIPFGLEGAQSSATLEMVERALFASDRARGGSFGDVRDVGVAVRGHWSRALDYHVGAFNGSGESQNDVDANLAKALIGRAAVRPWTALQLGVSGVYAGTTAGDAPRRDRVGMDGRLQVDHLLVQAEAVSGHDGSLSRRGMYVLAGYHVQQGFDVHTRFDAWDPDADREADAASATERDYAGGVTWKLLATGIKAQADLTRRTYSSALSPNRWQLLLNLQTTW